MTNGTDAVDKAVLAIDIATLGFPERLQRSLHAAGQEGGGSARFSGDLLKKLRNVVTRTSGRWASAGASSACP